MPLSRKLALYLLEGKATISEVTFLLEKYDLLTLLPSIKQSLIQMSFTVNRDEVIMIETPHNLSEDSIGVIKKIIGNSGAPHVVSVNKKVLAGFKAKFRGMMYDGSAERIIRQITN